MMQLNKQQTFHIQHSYHFNIPLTARMLHILTSQINKHSGK